MAENTQRAPGTSDHTADERPTSEAASSAENRTATAKRKNYIGWDEYFMGIAFLSAQRSKDPNTQVGACIVNKECRIVGVGYNGMPNLVHDDLLSWAHGEGLESKYPYVCYATMNAVINSNSANLKGCRIFLSLFPSSECAKIIIQSGIEGVIYYSDKYADTDSVKAAKKLLEKAKVWRRQYRETEGKLTKIVVDFDDIEPNKEGPSTSKRQKTN